MNMSFYLYIIAIAIIVGLARYNLLNPPILKWFIFNLICALIVETIGIITSKHGIHNLVMFNLFTCAEFIFYSIMYRSILESQLIKKIITNCIFIYIILFLINISLIEKLFKDFHTITYRIGSVMIITWCYLYCRQIMRDENYIPLFQRPFFWISTGLIFFYAGFFFYMSGGNYLLQATFSSNKQLFNSISNSLNALLYSCFLISFVCQKTPVISK